jgi:hypothetical protein
MDKNVWCGRKLRRVGRGIGIHEEFVVVVIVVVVIEE